MRPTQSESKPHPLSAFATALIYESGAYCGCPMNALAVSIPGPPRSLKAVPVSPTAIRVYWEPPEGQKEGTQHYQLSYQEAGTTEEEEKRVTTMDTWYHLKNLKKYTEYNIWITAMNQNSTGISSEETLVRTFSDGEICWKPCPSFPLSYMFLFVLVQQAELLPHKK